MRKIIIVFIGLALLIISCDKDETEDTSFNAIVLGIGSDCGNSFLIKFNDIVNGIPENAFNNRQYYDLKFKLARVHVYARTYDLTLKL